MEVGTNAPSEELLKKWYSDIDKFPEEVENLGDKQARYLKRYIININKSIREKYCIFMIQDHEDILDQIFKDYLVNKIYNWTPVDDKERADAEFAVTLDSKMGSYFVLDYVTNIDASLMYELATNHDIIVERVSFDKIYMLDEKNRYITSLINTHLDCLNETKISEPENNMDERDICKTKFTDGSAIFVYSMVRFFSDYLELNLRPSQYKYASHGGKYIGETIFAKIPKDDIKGGELTITDLATQLYMHVYHNKKNPNWDLSNGKDRFNDKYKSVIALSTVDLNEMEECIMKHKLEIIASYKN